MAFLNLTRRWGNWVFSTFKTISICLVILTLFFPSGIVYANPSVDSDPDVSLKAETANTTVTVTVKMGNGKPLNATTVYAFSSATYKNINAKTNSSGIAKLSLPKGNYRFRIDYNAMQYWSAA
ncbi:MAG: hypothetical protein LWX83_08270, partial [Anaerolineae bacterium]|nr:hypothetical protein [Anaerolineae bacterium]